MTRLPIPGDDKNTWGDLLNEFLAVEHNADGTLKSSGSLSAKADNTAAVHVTGAETIAGAKTFLSSPIVPTPTNATDVANKAYVDITASSGTPDATGSLKGKLQLAGDLGGTAAAPTVPGLSNKVGKGDLFINPRDAAYGAVADGVTDDTAAVLAAFAAANALNRTGVISTIVHPGATVILRGRFNLASLASAIPIRCNVLSAGAEFIVPASYAGTAVLVGHATSGSILQAAHIALPDVVRPTGSPIVAGSVGVTVQNLYSSELEFGRTIYFETGINITGLGNGTVYNRIGIGWVSYCKVALQLKPLAGGWTNQNVFTGGGIQQSAGYSGGVRIAGYRHLVLDGAGIAAVDGNTFNGVSFEGDVSENCFYIHHAFQNTWNGCRFEAGTAGVPMTVSGSTLTATAHGLIVGDLIAPTATVEPTGFIALTPYYVVSVPTADTFTISRSKGGSAITFGSPGTGVSFARPHRIYFDTSGVGTSANVIRGIVSPLPWLDLVHSTAIASGNVLETGTYRTANQFSPEDLPLYRARNASASTATVRPLYAAYAPTVNPQESPDGWSTALSDRGVLFSASRLLSADSVGLKYNNGVTTETVAFSSGAYFGPRTWITGHYHTPSNITVTTLAQVAGNGYTVPIWVPEATTVFRIAVQVTVLAAGATLELALYSSDTTDRPVTRVASYGTVDASTTGFKEIVITQALSRGWYWAACLTLGGTPTVNINSAGHFMVTSPSGSLSAGLNGFFLTGISALPTTWPSYNGVGFSPIIALRS